MDSYVSSDVGEYEYDVPQIGDINEIRKDNYEEKVFSEVGRPSTSTQRIRPTVHRRT